jgi:succinate-semialdehyde dehydrogenase/glutarate-semialdehyde dehydrogenase
LTANAIRISAPNLVLAKHDPAQARDGLPQCALAIEELLADAGAPPSVFANLFVDVPDLPRMVENPLVRGARSLVAIAPGRHLAKTSAANVNKVVLELQFARVEPLG